MVLAVAMAIRRLRLPVPVRRLLLAGLALRVLGSQIYLHGIGAAYGGGDYVLYFTEGLALAKTAFSGGPYSIWDPEIWTQGVWWGTSFTIRITGLLLVVIGPTLSGAFIVFAVIGYLGVLGVVLAFHRTYPSIPLERFLFWLVAFPSLWFWPTALGKDALVLCGVGAATFGAVAKRGGGGWLLLGLGVALVFCVRPQVAATLVFSIGAAHWLGSGLKLTPKTIGRGILVLAGGLWVVTAAGGNLGVELFDPDQVESYLAGASDRSDIGGSAMGRAEQEVNPWFAPINTLFRPFLWEANGVTALLSALEMVGFWGLAWRRRGDIRRFLRTQRNTRLFWLAVVFSLAYATALGMSLSNLGIVARQRVHILPFLFLFLAGDGTRATLRARRTATGQTRVSGPLGSDRRGPTVGRVDARPA